MKQKDPTLIGAIVLVPLLIVGFVLLAAIMLGILAVKIMALALVVYCIAALMGTVITVLNCLVIGTALLILIKLLK